MNGGPEAVGRHRHARRRTLVVVSAVLAVFAVLRWVAAFADPAQATEMSSRSVVVVGVTARSALTEVDRTVLDAHLGDAQVGAVNVRPREVGECAAAGWTTLGAGRRATVGGLCDPQVADGRIADWAVRRAAAHARRGDAQLGTLAASVSGCVGAVGPGAALAAARPDGSVSHFESAEDFVADGLRTSCATTLVDAGDRTDEVITRLAADRSRVLLVTGIGPASGSDDPSLQVLYRLGAATPGWLSSASTRRQGVVTLTDLTRTLIDHDRPAGSATPLTVDGSPLTVFPAQLSVAGVEHHLAAVRGLSDSAPVGYLALGSVGAVLFGALVGLLSRRRWAGARRILTLGTVLLPAMTLTGSVPWQDFSRPGLVLSLVVLGGAAALTVLALGIARRLRVPAPVVSAGMAVVVLTVDAALGGPLQPGSLLNSRPIYGLRWYGFGNVTFSAYATSGLLLGGYLAHRCLLASRRRAAATVVAVIGLGIVVCEGWPTMGTDFGGVIAFTPPVLWLVLVLSGVGVTPARLLAVGLGTLAVISTISLLDWTRGPDRRTHLGNFVQRIIDGDAGDVVSRKALASLATIVRPTGIVCVVLGIILWVLILRFAVPLLEVRFSTLRPVLLAALGTAVLGTALNDGGISVWLTVTADVTVIVGWFLTDHLQRRESERRQHEGTPAAGDASARGD